MGRLKKFGKRKFYSNRFTNSSKGNIIANENVSNTPITQANLNVAHGVNNMQTPPSASRRKLHYLKLRMVLITVTLI
ncbi:hypothetical protein C0J52_02869 [Blattella germanica]|nr:hypothetical protein C0J52_02869 [Blattella germanica]